MSQKRQSSTLKQRVEQLVAEGKKNDAYSLLVQQNWIPRGSGYQQNYPHGLRIYTKVDKTKQILVSKSGRYWAWDAPTEDVESLKQWRDKLKKMDLPEIASLINEYEGLSWQLNHDAADGRIPNDIDNSLLEIRKKVRMIVEIFADKAGVDIEDHQAMRDRIQKELGNYEGLLANKWKDLFCVGVIFRVIQNSGPDPLFEAVNTYLPQKGCIGPSQIIFAREINTGFFACFDNRNVDRLNIEKIESIYTNGEGFLKTSGTEDFPRIRSENDIRHTGAVFHYAGGKDNPRNGTWETFYVFSRVESPHAEVIIARSHDKDMIAEFMADDLYVIVKSTRPRKFIEKTTHGTTIPVLSI